MKNTELQRKGLDYHGYIEVQSPEEGMYKVLKDYVDGKLTWEDLEQLASRYINSFPPFQFFMRRSGSDDFLREQVKSVSSPAEFAHTELFQIIMTSPNVVERFKKASPHVYGVAGNKDYPPYWPQQYRVKQAPGTADGKDEKKQTEAQSQVRDWRTTLKELFGWI
jgi:hypothetical protein